MTLEQARLTRHIRQLTLASCMATLLVAGSAGAAQGLPEQASDQARERVTWHKGERLEKIKDALDRIRLKKLDRIRNLSRWNHFPDASDFDDKATNLAVLIQTLDQDGDLNNGIDVSRAAARILATYTDRLTLDQPPAEFARSPIVADLMAELNAGGEAVFNDTDPRPRRLRNADDAVELVARAQSDRKIVPTSLGVVRGYTTPDDKAWSFYGIPYAKPPLGDLRWKPPVPHEGWRGVRDAIAWADQSAQDPANEAFGEGGMSEDSLYLNITVPKDAGDEPDVLAAMRAVPWPELVAAANEARFAARPNIDGWYQTMGIRDAFEAGEHHDVPIMAGANTGDLPPLIEGLKWYMPWMAEYNESEVYAYVFDHVPAGWRNFGTSAYHGVELVYMFDYPGSFVAHYLLGLTGHPEPTPAKFATTDNPGIDPAEYELVSQLSLDLWASFAKDGDPSIERQPWPAYTAENDTYLRIDLTPAVETGLDEAFPDITFPIPTP